MSTTGPAEALEPYLSPDYWSGHSIGYGMPTGEWPNRPVAGRELRGAKKTLQARLALMEKVVPIETYKEGQVFEADTYEEGTIVLFREESLTGREDELNVNVESLKGYDLPARPYDVSPSFGPTSTTETITDGNTTYFTAAKWGIVGVAKNREKVLRTVSTGLVDKIGAGRVLVVLPSLGTRFSPVDIGQTNHYRQHAGFERIERVNILDVVAYGDVKRQESPLGRLAAKLSFSGSVA